MKAGQIHSMSAEAGVPMVTLDTCVVERVVSQHAKLLGYGVQIVSVTVREVEGTTFELLLEHTRCVPELGHYGESHYGEAVYAGPNTCEVIEVVLEIIANGSFPTTRTALTDGQRHQLRDAMILEAHVRSGADLFVTDDKRAYINHGRREALQERLGVRILLVQEFLGLETITG